MLYQRYCSLTNISDVKIDQMLMLQMSYQRYCPDLVKRYWSVGLQVGLRCRLTQVQIAGTGVVRIIQEEREQNHENQNHENNQ